ncbi:MAG: hypothetical protein HZB59_09835 [Ignavibacteriales bacterium]|nr:hypothetical protein [Ignavibacteriales bacterium]
MDRIIRGTENRRSLIDGCGMLHGLCPRSASSLRERCGTSRSPQCVRSNREQKKLTFALTADFPRNKM